MFLDEQYALYQMTNHFIQKEQFEILTVNENADEIWLEKYENKTTVIVRLIHKGFDWKNHLRNDIAKVFQVIRNMQRVIRGKNVELHNVYVSTNEPVDDWKDFKKKMQLKDKLSVKMNVYYLDEATFDDELNRLQKNIGAQTITINLEVTEAEKEEKVRENRQVIIDSMENKQTEYQDIFSYGKSYITYFFIIINIVLFILLEINGGSTATRTLIDFGAKYNPAMMEYNEWWRLISSMFLHIGFLHLFLNMLALYYLGPLVERIYGPGRYIYIYLLAGIGGALTSFAFNTSISAGASGAIFGLFGALLFFGMIHRRIFLQTMGWNIIYVLGINLALGIFIQEIDMAAHLGGLIAGILASAMVHLPKTKDNLKQLLAAIIFLILIIGLVIWGYQNNLNKQAYHLMVTEELLIEKNYEEVIHSTTAALSLDGDLQGILLFQRSFAFIELNKIDLAINDLEESITYESMPESYFNLAILYYNTGEMEKAEESIKLAYQMNPEDDAFIDLYEELTGETVRE